MNPFQSLFYHPLTQSIGSGLLHFVWQGVLIAILLAIALRLLKNASPEFRYLAGWSALLLMVAAPAFTITNTLRNSEPPLPYYEQAFNLPNSVGGEQLSPANSVATTTPAQTQRQTQQQTQISALQQINYWVWASRPYITLLWVLGVVFFAIRLNRGAEAISRLRSSAISTLNEQTVQSLKRLCRNMGIENHVQLKSSHLIDQPVLIGWIKPMILLPASLATGLTADQITAVLAHELAHIKRHDYFFSTVQSLIETLLFFHPAVWWVSNQISNEREFCCDDMAVRALDSKKVYLQTLSDIESSRMLRLSLSMQGGSLMARVKRLIEQPVQSHSAGMNRKPSFVAVLMLLILTATSVVACKEISLKDDLERTVTSDIELPADLAHKIKSVDIEGTITQLHDIRESGDPDALSIAYAAYEQAFDDELRENLVFVFAHFNSLEADQVLIKIINSDGDEQVRTHAIRAIVVRTQPQDSSPFSRALRKGHDAELFQYPTISEEQLSALKDPIIEIALNEDQYIHVRTYVIKVLVAIQGMNYLLDEIFHSTSVLEIRLSAFRGLSSHNKSHTDALLGLYRSSNDSDKWQIGLTLGGAASIEIVPDIIQLMKEEQTFPDARFDPGHHLTNALRQITHRIPVSSFSEMKQLILDARAQAGNLGPFEESLDQIVHTLNMLIADPNYYQRNYR